jgi:hypothetical protein
LSNPEETYTLVCPGEDSDYDSEDDIESTCWIDQGFDQFVYDYVDPSQDFSDFGNVAIEFYLDSPNNDSGIDTASISQYVSVCPGSTYTFSVQAYLDTTYNSPNDYGQSCTITLSLGTSTDTNPLKTIGTNKWSGLVSNPYTTGADETRTLLDINLQCGQSAFSDESAADVYFDAVHLSPITAPATPPATSP